MTQRPGILSLAVIFSAGSARATLATPDSPQNRESQIPATGDLQSHWNQPTQNARYARNSAANCGDFAPISVKILHNTSESQ
jgi:hypothetical protein